MNFNEAVEIILKHEGGYSLDPRDPGGETQFGISKRSYPNLDIKNLTRETAIAIYRKDFWDKCKIESLPGKLRLMVFDAAVNHGVSAASKFLQAVAQVNQDGKIGRITLGEINRMDPEQVLRLYADFRIRHYVSNKNFVHYGAGWMSRLMNIIVDSLV